MTHDLALSLERLDAALYAARSAAADAVGDGLPLEPSTRLLSALSDAQRVSWAAQGRRLDPGPSNDRSVINAQAATIAELQATVKRLAQGA